MKIINNRYHIDMGIYSSFFVEAYKVHDKLKNSDSKFLKIYDYNLQKELIDYFILNQYKIRNIKHKNILCSEEFNIVTTIDSGNTNSSMYYAVSEHIEYSTIFENIDKLSFKDRLYILLDLLLTINFLHFRGFTYKFLNPLQIALIDRKTIKLQSLFNITEKTYNNEYTEFERTFLSPDFISKNEENDKELDYYSLARMIEYLFEDTHKESSYSEIHYNEENVSKFFKLKVEDLENREFKTKDVNLVGLVNEIVEFFSLDFHYDLIKERDNLFLENQIVGRSKEVARIIDFDTRVTDKLIHPNLILVSGKNGIGKSRFLDEIYYRLTLRNRNVFTTNLEKNTEDEVVNVAELLLQAMNGAPDYLKEKYSEEFSMILVEEKLDENWKLDVDYESKKYRVFNRIANYLKDLATSKTIYLVFDNLQNGHVQFLDLLEYLMNTLKNSNVICVLAFDRDDLEIKEITKRRIENWRDTLSPLEIDLGRLDLEEIGELVKNILGMGYIHWEFSTVLFKESNGKPKRVEELILYLYNEGQLYMGENGKWVLDTDHISDIYIPNRLDGSTFTKLSNLSKASYGILKIISIFNDLLPIKVLTNMIDDDKNVEAILKELKQERLIEKKIADWGYSYSISNIDVKKYIYFEIEQHEKRKLHNKAIDTIEELEGGLYDSLFEELIYHLIKAMKRDHALEIILRKIDLLENTSGSDAMYLLEKAYGIFTPETNVNKKLEILQKMIEATLLKGELKENDSYLTQYSALADQSGIVYHILNYKKYRAEIFIIRGSKELFLQQIKEIRKINEDANILEFEVYCVAATAYMDTNLGEFKKAEEGLIAALKVAEEFNIIHQFGNIYNLLGNVKYLTGFHNEATVYYEKSYEFFKADRDVIRSVKPINNLGNIYVTHLNDSKKAVEYYQRGLEISRIHGLKNMQLIFSINISELSKSNFEYDTALEYLLEGNKIALELQDTMEIAICQSLLGSIYLEKEKYDKAYDCYAYVNSVVIEDRIKSIELSIASYDFLGNFYFCIGQWDDALTYYNLSKELYAQNDIRQYYKFKFKIILAEFFKNNMFVKPELDKLIEEYGTTIYVEDFRHIVLIVALLSIKLNDIDYAKKYLALDTKVKHKTEIKFLNELRSHLIYVMDLNDGNFLGLRNGVKEDFSNEYFPYKTMIMNIAATVLEKQNKYKVSLKFYMDALENIYKNAMKIPRWETKISYIKARETDKIKDSINHVLRKYYGLEINQIRLVDIAEENFEILNSYFDFNAIIELVGIEEFSEIAEIQSYGKATDILDIESLISNLKIDYQYNLDLILNFISKEAFATNAAIIEYNKDLEEYEVISSLNSSKNFIINEGILIASAKVANGLLVKAELDNSVNMVYKNFLSKDMAAVICVPIDMAEFSVKTKNNRRTDGHDAENVVGFIYIETNRVFNNFNENMLKAITDMAYLVYMNIEINRIGLMATTDKLTGAFTRKYYDEQFNELIESSKAKGNKFFVLMLDLDKFKAINDTYGHRKGDEVLRSVGEIIKANIRATDIFGRYGGEEFVVILKYIDEEEALIIGEKIRNSIENLKVEGIKKPITISIGISSYPNHSKFKEDLVEKADQALYHAKHSGRNRISLWNLKMDGIFERVDKLAGILTGVSEIDNKNILGIVQIVNLIEEDEELSIKIFKYLGELLNIVDAEMATLIIIGAKHNESFTRVKSEDRFSKTPLLNEKILKRIQKNKKGEFLIDWDNLDDFDKVSGIPNFKSVIVVPMLKNGEVRGITYLSSSLDHKEFDFNALNLTKNFAGIFTSLI